MMAAVTILSLADATGAYFLMSAFSVLVREEVDGIARSRWVATAVPGQ